MPPDSVARLCCKTLLQASARWMAFVFLVEGQDEVSVSFWDTLFGFGSKENHGETREQLEVPIPILRQTQVA